ncbi:DUF6259 domain-containing protein [Spirosoma sp. 209]|uniref:DUF6259 domain-containing protein n=1 Tax=Spirosoma sp. 209 TaxID=1955701 RepID=UPI001116661A|nr:DUF6259 domain-containing protein [Spirosoma sp. 209]
MIHLRSLRPLYFGLALLAAGLWPLTGLAQSVRLSTTHATLSVDRQGNLTIAPKGSTTLATRTPLSKLWKLTLQNRLESTILAPKLVEVLPETAPEVAQTGNEIVLTYSGLQGGGRALPVKAVFRVGVKDDAFVFSGNLSIEADKPDASPWLLRELTYPILSDIQAKDSKPSVYWPESLGRCYTDPASMGKLSFDYPSGRGSMQWFTINTPQQGLYIGCHDADRTKKQFEVAYNTPSASFSSAITFPVFSTTFTVPEVNIAPYGGTWHTGAKRYRTWYLSQFTLPTLPTWVKQDAGWFLAILKQQNGYVMWRYDEIDKLCDIADRFGLKTLGLFGWAHGGHDRLFPNWIPDDLLGGQPALKAGIERAHKRGFKVILYANATMMDATSEYYKYAGNQTMAVREDQMAYTSSIRKYNSATPVVFVESSYSSAYWRKTMMNLALQARELGADGILYDQAGVKGALLNFSKIQDHKLPQESGTKYRVMMLNEIRTAMKKLDPEFIIMTEATHDGVLDNIDYHHGWGIGTAIEPIGFGSAQYSFPALYRYTFPELVETQRNANPMITRAEANFAVVYGLRHEIESRYEEDVDYLVKGKMPTAESYAEVTYYPPVPAKIREAPADVATQYVSDLIRFENAHALFLRMGTFVDEEGFQVSGPDITAKGFRQGDRLGIVVWNTNPSADRSVAINVPGYRLVEAHEPNRGAGGTATASPASTLKPNSIRLLIYGKNN